MKNRLHHYPCWVLAISNISVYRSFQKLLSQLYLFYTYCEAIIANLLYTLHFLYNLDSTSNNFVVKSAINFKYLSSTYNFPKSGTSLINTA